jgi:hypothetical protein
MDLINCLENSEVGEGKEGGYMVCKKDQKKFKDEQKKNAKMEAAGIEKLITGTKGD